ncbi:MAG: phosphatidate cytidylyltransferase [Polyangiaceae bacterium]
MQRSAGISNQPNVLALSALAGLSLSLNGCAIIGGIFKAGVWVGVIAVVAVIALVMWGVRAAKR